MISSGENGGDINVDGATDIISWLLSLLDIVGDNPILKGIAGKIGQIMEVVNVIKDYLDCGLEYALAKFYSVYFITLGITFIFLPFLAIFLSLYIAFAISYLSALAVSLLYSSAWSCRRE